MNTSLGSAPFAEQDEADPQLGRSTEWCFWQIRQKQQHGARARCVARELKSWEYKINLSEFYEQLWVDLYRPGMAWRWPFWTGMPSTCPTLDAFDIMPRGHHSPFFPVTASNLLVLFCSQ